MRVAEKRPQVEQPKHRYLQRSPHRILTLCTPLQRAPGEKKRSAGQNLEKLLLLLAHWKHRAQYIVPSPLIQQ